MTAQTCLCGDHRNIHSITEDGHFGRCRVLLCGCQRFEPVPADTDTYIDEYRAMWRAK